MVLFVESMYCLSGSEVPPLATRSVNGMKATSEVDMAERSASPSFSQPRKPPDDVILGAASQMVLNAALRNQHRHPTHPTARPEAENNPRPRGDVARAPRTEAEDTTDLASHPDDVKLGAKPPRPKPHKSDDNARVGAQKVS